jgi:hypothetical protein
VEYQTIMKSLWPIMPVSRKLMSRIWIPGANALVFLEGTTYAATDYWSLIKTAGETFKKSSILCFRTHVKGLKVLDSPGTDLGWINSWTLNMYKIHPTVQGTGELHSNTFIQTQGERTPKWHYQAQKDSNHVNPSDVWDNFFMIPVL